MRAVIDNALPESLFAQLSSEALQCVKGEFGLPDFGNRPEWAHLKRHVEVRLGPIQLDGAFFMETAIGQAGSSPHRDHGKHSAVLHLNPRWRLHWGGDFLFLRDHEHIDAAIEFQPNRLCIWDSEQLHCHRGPNLRAEKNRVTLVMRMSDAI